MNKEQYTKGLHILADIEQVSAEPLQNMLALKTILDEAIEHLGLQKVGEVYYSFDGGGYTATICLTESHIAVHTWPEFGRVTYDVFLSNFQHVNDGKVEEIHGRLSRFFEGKISLVEKIYR